MNVILKFLINKILTERFLIRVGLLILKHLSKKTTNQLDGPRVDELERALSG
ncbi:hypothetical protein [Algicola sagamiensis]|uniref:hypothetical protein n=1 Tax=Algicola sagamiensis TaxID=163869 RepID=UPI000369B6DB|nr:hypothetical protein [Algicola sagamiensis]